MIQLSDSIFEINCTIFEAVQSKLHEYSISQTGTLLILSFSFNSQTYYILTLYTAKSKTSSQICASFNK